MIKDKVLDPLHSPHCCLYSQASPSIVPSCFRSLAYAYSMYGRFPYLPAFSAGKKPALLELALYIFDAPLQRADK